MYKMARKGNKKKQKSEIVQLDSNISSHQCKDPVRSENRKRKSHKLESSVRETKQRRRQSEEKGDNHSETQRGKATVIDTNYVGESEKSDDGVKEQKVSDRTRCKSFQDLPKPSARKSRYKVQEQQLPHSVADGDIPPVRCIKVDGGCVLTLNHPETLSFQGKAQVMVLCGEVSVCGHRLTVKSPPVSIFSPVSHSLLTVTSEKKLGIVNKKKIVSSWEKHQLCVKDIDNIIPNITTDSVVLLLKKVESSCCNFVSKFSPFQTLFTKCSIDLENSLFSGVRDVLGSIDVQMGTVTDTIPPVMNIPADFIAVQDKWLSILKEKDVAPKALSCGGKNVGKSTFNRYLINSTLQRVKSLCYLDCDVGQTEFNPPGCIALHVIHEPVLGPPFTHQQDPFFMCFFGLVSPAEDPRFYSSCMKKVYSQYESMDPKPPLIINTMGWNKGLGINLLVDTCHITCPDLIIQLESMNQSNNFPAVTPDFLHYSPGWLFNRNAESDEEEHKFKHELIIVDSPVVPNIESQLRFHSRDHRDLTTLGYISRCLRSAQGLQEVQPYCVPWKHIALHTCHLAVPPSQILAAFNASFVALCVTDHSKARHIQDNPELPLHFDKTPVCECLGMGIVAGIDMETHEIYLVCPIDLSHLKRVNTLIRGALNLPDQLLLRQKNDSGLPYVGKHLSMIGSSSVRPRRYMPRKRGESNKYGTDE